MAIIKLFHGANGDKLLYILNNGKMIPDSQNEIYFDETGPANCFVHGVDSKKKSSFVLQVEVELNGLHFYRTQKPGNPRTLIVQTFTPLPIKVLEMYIRSGTVNEGFVVSRIVDEKLMRLNLL